MYLSFCHFVRVRLVVQENIDDVFIYKLNSYIWAHRSTVSPGNETRFETKTLFEYHALYRCK